MDDLGEVVKELVDDSVVNHKKPETIEEYLDQKGITNLCDIVKHSNPLSRILSVPDTINNMRHTLYQSGYLRDVPIDLVIASLGKSGPINSYIDPNIVGEDNAEENRTVVLESDEFREDINKKYSSLCDVNDDKSVAKILNINRNKSDIRRSLYELGFLRDVPIGKVILDAGKKGHKNPYLDPEIVGEENVEKNRRVVLESDEFKKYINDKYDSLYDINKNRGLAKFLNVNRTQNSIRKVLYGLGLLRNISIDKVIVGTSTVNRNPYLDPNVVGEDVEKNRKQILESSEFREHIEEKYTSLCDMINYKGLSKLLDVDRKIDSVRRKLYDLGLLRKVPIAEIIINAGKFGNKNPYLNSKIVGDDVEKNRTIVIKSNEYRKYVETKYDSLYDVKQNRNLSTLLNIKNNSSNIRRELYNLGLLRTIPINEALANMSKVGNRNPYLDLYIVGGDVEKNRKIILESEEFKVYIKRKYKSLNDVGQEKSLSTLLNTLSTQSVLRLKLTEMGFFGMHSIVTQLMEGYAHD